MSNIVFGLAITSTTKLVTLQRLTCKALCVCSQLLSSLCCRVTYQPVYLPQYSGVAASICWVVLIMMHRCELARHLHSQLHCKPCEHGFTSHFNCRTVCLLCLPECFYSMLAGVRSSGCNCIPAYGQPVCSYEFITSTLCRPFVCWSVLRCVLGALLSRKAAAS